MSRFCMIVSLIHYVQTTMQSSSWRTGAYLIPLIALLLVIGCERTAPAQMRGIHLAEPVALPDLELTDTKGRPFRLLEETRGRLALVFFGYTYCPDICPMHMANIAAVMKDMPFEAQSKTRVIFVSVDPKRDTPQRLETWLKKFNPHFIGVTAPAEVLRKFEKAVNVAEAVTIPVEGSDYSVGHASQVLAFEADGKARYVYPFGTRQRDWAHDLPHLVPEGDVKLRSPKVAMTKTADSSVQVGLHVDTVLIPAPPEGGPAALFAVIANTGRDDELIGFSAPGVKRAELHETVSDHHGKDGHQHGGAMRMQQVEAFPVRAGEGLRLEPGRKHGMLMGLEGEFAQGGTVAVEFRFRHAGRVTATARIVPYAEIEHALAPKVEQP